MFVYNITSTYYVLCNNSVHVLCTFSTKYNTFTWNAIVIYTLSYITCSSVGYANHDIDISLHETNNSLLNECHRVNIEDGHLHYFTVYKFIRAVKK